MIIDIDISVESTSNRSLGNGKIEYSLGTVFKGKYEKKRYFLSMSDCNCNRAVLEGLYDALQKIKGTGHTINITCPSWYVVNSIRNGNVLRWARNGHKTSKGKDVAQMDLWMKVTPILLKKMWKTGQNPIQKNSCLLEQFKKSQEF